jgi:hypothetical protein
VFVTNFRLISLHVNLYEVKSKMSKYRQMIILTTYVILGVLNIYIKQRNCSHRKYFKRSLKVNLMSTSATEVDFFMH